MEVVALIEVLDEPGMCRLPAQQLAGQRARDRVVGREEEGQKAEVLARLAGRDADHRDADVECERRSPYTLSASDAQNAPFGAAPMVMGTACHNVPNGGHSLVTGTNGDHLG